MNGCHCSISFIWCTFNSNIKALLVFQVVPGIGFRQSGSYVQLSGIPSLSQQMNSIRYIDFEFLTYEPHGILLYAKNSVNNVSVYQLFTVYVVMDIKKTEMY